jgi:alanine racemase
MQWTRFEQVVEVMREAGVSPGFLHAANSAAAILYPSLMANVVRPGYFLYGGTAEGVKTPRPVLAVKARIASVRDVRAGQTVSYGATYTAPEDGRLATVAIGYGDGLPWRLSNNGGALVDGQMAPIRGAVCMDSTVLDVTGIAGVRSGDVVTFLGTDGQGSIGLEALAQASGTIGYEILTGWTARLPRVEVGDEA